MDRGKIANAIKAGKILCADGAWGTLLMEKGFRIGESSALWSLDRPDDVMDIANAYINAGADMIQTNSFGGTCFRLSNFGLANKASEINEAAAHISRAAAGAGRWVIASAGPAGGFSEAEKMPYKDLYAAFKEQALALEKGGADAICIETMMSIRQATTAIKAAKENTSLEIICTYAFQPAQNGGMKTIAGEPSKEACMAAAESGADIVGANCCSSIDHMVNMVKEVRCALPYIPIMVQANAGLPVVNENGEKYYPSTPEAMAVDAIRFIDAGANIIGGCCGTTPAHIRAIKTVISGEYNHV